MIEVLFRHPDFLVVNKPQGINIHCEPESIGLVVRLQQQLELDQLYPVHRLDKITSGITLLATNSNAASKLSTCFHDRSIEKFYLALTDKKPKKKQGTVSGYMAPARRGSWKLTSEKDGNKSRAISQFFSFGLGNGQRLFLIKPLSGKTHQIRVMMKSLSAPITGDTRYSGSGADRGYLHAFAINFDYNNQNYKFICPPSAGIQFLDKNYQKLLTKNCFHPWNLQWPKAK